MLTFREIEARSEHITAHVWELEGGAGRGSVSLHKVGWDGYSLEVRIGEVTLRGMAREELGLEILRLAGKLDWAATERGEMEDTIERLRKKLETRGGRWLRMAANYLRRKR